MRLARMPIFAVLSAGLLATAGVRAADEPKTELKVGDKAPAFEAKDDKGKDWKLSDHVGKHILVVYFYPADMTGGCTKQACGFRDDSTTLAEKGVEVVGISGDSVKNHKVFKKVHMLGFTLLADEEGAVAKKFGVPVNPGGDFKTKDADGNEITLTRGVTIQRWTFIIGKDGKIAHIDTKVNAAADSGHVLEAVEKLQEKK